MTLILAARAASLEVGRMGHEQQQDCDSEIQSTCVQSGTTSRR